ncbi:MAG TPA: ParB/RepB/Spo0J family partition protein [Acidimicrobiales bacterium]
MARRSGLGRGLGALIPEDAEDELGASFQELPMNSIVPNPFQPRSEFDDAGIASLADSIEQVGVLQPILVRPDGDGAYQLIAGERRWRAAQQAGLTVIPAIVREVRDVSALEHAVIENLHRQDLNALEEAAAYQQLIDDFGFTQQQLAQRIGKSRPSVANTLRLLNLPPAIQGLLIDGRLAAAHARALLGVEDRVEQQRLAEQAVAEGWSVRQVEQAVKEGAPARPKAPDDSPQPGTTRPAALLELEELLSSHLDTRVAVQTGAKRGKIVVEFADLDDLERLYRIIIAGD